MPTCVSHQRKTVADKCVKKRTRLVVALLALVAVGADDASNWPGFRGPGGLGVSTDVGLPVTWGPDKNVVWKMKMPGPGSSSPIIWGERVFITCYTDYGLVKNVGDVAKLKRNLLCVERTTGKLLWRKELPTKLPEVKFGQYIIEHGYASSTPATDGQRVYVFFGRSGALAFDFEGKQLWEKEVGTFLNGWGTAGSPVLYKNLVILNASVEASAVVALDKESGKEVWRCKKIGDCWTTPIIVKAPDGKDELVLHAQNTIVGIEPHTGAKLWTCDGPGSSAASSSPVARDGIVYVMAGGGPGGGTPSVVAVKTGGRGEVTKTHILWTQKGGANHSSLVLVGEHLFWVNNKLTCARAKTGELVFQERLYEGRPEYVSPVAADGKLFIFTRGSGAYVVAASGKFEQLAHNDLGDTSNINASPAISHGRLFVRSNAYLYCLGNKR